ETGTACRTAERVIGRWGEEFGQGDPEQNDRWTQRMFRQLNEGVEVGEVAIATVHRIRDLYRLADKVDKHRLALRTGFQNPGIMTARAALLALPLTYEV